MIASPLILVYAILISDIHVGSPVSRSKALLATLKKYHFRLLIINGDFFDDLNFTRLTRDDWELLSYLRKISNPKYGVRVIWARGNHDEPASEAIPHLIGAELVEEFEWEYNGERYLAIHGDQFDRFILENPITTAVFSAIYVFLQTLDKKTHRFSRFVKRVSKTWLRLSDEVAEKALAYGARKGVRHIICGHTHMAFEREKAGVHFYNSGCWTDIPSTYITIDDAGIHTHTVDEHGADIVQDHQPQTATT